MSCLNRGASLAVLAILTAPMAAAAQSAPQPAPAKTNDSQVEALVVTGYALGNQLAVESKQAADTTADFLVADEVNRMPDSNVSDAFRRAPGVYTVFDEDEGRYVGIRGLNPDFTIAQFNGALISSSERDNRRVNLEAIPSSAVKRLEVFKSRTANLEGNAIGGTVNLVTRSAFDAKGFYLAGSGGVGYTDHQVVPGKNYRRDGNNGPSYRGDLTLSDTFFDDRFGMVLSGSFMERRRDQQRYQTGAVTTSAGGLPVTPSVTYAGYPNTIDRFGGFAKFEFKPVDSLYIDAVVSRYTQEDKELRYQQILTMRGTQTASGANTIAFPQGQALIRLNDYFIQKPVVTAQSHLRWDISEKQNFRAGVSYSHAMWHEPSNQPTFTTANNSASLGGAYSYDDGTPVVTLNNTAFYLNPANYGFTNYIKYDQHNKDYVYQYNADYSFNTGRSDYGFGFDAGAEFRKNIRDFDDDRTTWTLKSGNSLNAANFILGDSFTGPFANQGRLILDGGAFTDYFDKNTALFQGAVDNTSADYRFDEQVSIAYGQAVYRGERYKVLAGLRWERTETELKRPRVVNGAQTVIVRTNEYDNFLPSVTGWYNLTQNLKLRASYFKAVGRPNPIDLAGSEAVTIGSSGTPQISRGNPDLKARSADSYDASLEYYFPDRQGLVSVAIFDKQIKNEIFKFKDELLVDGVETLVTQPRNIAKASVKGVEFAYTQNNLGVFWRPLTGFGVNTNLSLFDGYSQVVGDNNQLLREIDQLREQPKSIVNTTVFYKHKAFETRLTYARSSSVPTSIATAATATSDARDLAYSQLDWSARYRLSKQLQLIAEVRNLANSTKTNIQTSDFGEVTRDYNIYGRTLFFGVSFKY